MKRSLILVTCLALASSSCAFFPRQSREDIIREERERTLRTEAAIQDTPRLQEVNAICSELPKPTGIFDLVFKRQSFDQRVYLTFGFSSDVPKEIAFPFYQGYFQRAGWTLVTESDSL